MATPAVIDIEALLAAIPGDSPVGSDIRADSSPASAYYKIKDARSAARAAERGNIDEAAALPEEWDTVIDVGTEILTTMSKDLEVAAWMTEALVRVNGFAGLRDGFKLIGGLADQYWDGVFPLPDEDGIPTRVGPVTGLNGEGADGTLVLPIRKAEITAGDHSYAFWQFEQATEVEKVTDATRKQARIDAGDLSMELLTTSVKQTPAGFYVDLLADIGEAQGAFKAMNDALAAKAGDDSPPYAKIRDMMEAVASAIRYLAADKLASAAPVVEAAAEEVAVAAGDAGGSAAAPAKKASGVYTREAAFADLKRIAEFFRKTEPHSPISYTIEDAIRRGNLPLPELLSELLEDANQRKAFMVAAGIKPPQE